MRNIRTLVFLFTSIVMIVGFSACDRIPEVIQPEGPRVTQTPMDTITIGVVLSMTGRFADTYGIATEEGFRLFLDEMRTAELLEQPHTSMAISDGQVIESFKGLRFIIADDKSSVNGAIDAFKRLIQAGVSVIVGPSTSKQTQAVFPIAQENQIVAISPTSSARGLSALGDYLFRVSLTNAVLIPRGIETTHAKLGYQNVATLYDQTDTFSTDAETVVQEALAANGIQVLTTQTIQGGDTDFAAQLSRIQTFAPDAIFVSSLAPEKVKIFRDGYELGITAPFIVGSISDDMLRSAGEAAEGTIAFVGWDPTAQHPKNQTFVANFQAKYGKPPNGYSAHPYATFHILTTAIRLTGAADATAVRDALAHLDDLETILGTFEFDTNGDAVYDPKVLIVSDGKLQRFE